MASLYVMLFHYLALQIDGLPRSLKLLVAPLSFGHFMVGVFIVLSGFSLMLSNVRGGEGEQKVAFGDYMMRRARRILPPYYAALLLSIGALLLISRWGQPSYITQDFSKNFDGAALASYLLLLHNWNYDHASINMALWSIATEWQIYFFFPLVFVPLWRNSSSLLLGVAFILSLIPVVLLPRMDLDYTCPWYLFLFATGMLGATLFQNEKFAFEKWGRTFLVAGVLCGLAYIALKVTDSRYESNYGLANLKWLKDIVGGGVAWCFIMACCHHLKKNASAAEAEPLDKRPGLALRVLQSPFAIWLGTFSYSLYLTHCITLHFVRYAGFSLHLAPLPYFALRLLVGLPLAVGLAYAFFLVFEKPFLRKKRRVVVPSAVA